MFLSACVHLNAQVLIDQPKRNPDFIISSKVDTVAVDYLVESGIFLGYAIKKTYTVEYAAYGLHSGHSFEQVIEVLDNNKKETVKKVLGIKELLIYGTGTEIKWGSPNMRFKAVPNSN